MKPPNMTSELEATLPVRLLTAGTAACFADLVTFPLDTAKVRLQIQGESLNLGATKAATATTETLKTRIPIKTNINGVPISSSPSVPLRQFSGVAVHQPTSNVSPQYRGLFGTISTISRQEGPRALYNGLSAGLQRQMCFASVRLGLYDSVKVVYQDVLNENPQGLQIFSRILAGLTTGGMAVILAQPTDVVKVRFQAERKVGTTIKPRYASTLDAYRTIGRTEGAAGLWKGAMSNIGRNAVVNVSEIVCYDIVKDCLLDFAKMNDNIYCHFTAAIIAGFATTVAASPIDVVKTRYMNSPKGQYSGALDCAIRMYRQEGFNAFYKGFVPSFARIVSWNIVLWITYEQVKHLVFTKTHTEDD